MISRTLAVSLLTALAATGIAAGTAAADSIVYAKDGELGLISPDGATGYQLTSGTGAYRSPSQADDGTIGALYGKQLARLDRSGHALNAPIDAIGSDLKQTSFAGPYDPRISPDGKKFSYWFYVSTITRNWDDPNRPYLDIGSNSAWTWADHFTSPASDSEYYKGLEQAEWLSNDRLLGFEGFWMNMWTWKLGTGTGYTGNAAQYWFGLQDAADQWGVEAYHQYEDPALSRDGTRLAMADGGGINDNDRLTLAATHGPAWSGEPPYTNDYVYGQTPFERPTIKCQMTTPGVVNPTWSSDGKQLAYGAADGVHVATIPSLDDCSSITDKLIVPGGKDPAFGPADVDPAQDPARQRTSTPSQPQQTGGDGAGGTAGGGGAGLVTARLSGFAVTPKAFRRGGHGTTLRFTLSAPVTLRLTVTRRGHRVPGAVRIAGRTGANRVHWNGRVAGRLLKPGAYRLTVTGPNGATLATTAFRVRRQPPLR